MELEWPEWDLMIGNAMHVEKTVYDEWLVDLTIL